VAPGGDHAYENGDVMAGLTRVLVADEDATRRSALHAALRDGGFVVCADVASVGVAVTVARVTLPHACLLAVRTPTKGIWATRALRAELPHAALVMLTDCRDGRELLPALLAGVDGYLPGDTDPAQLPRVLRAVLAGETALPRSLVTLVVDELRRREAISRRPDHGPLGHLTEREREILDLLCQGYTTGQIAARLVVQPVTVRTHISATLHKLGVSSRNDAIRLLRDESRGITPPQSDPVILQGEDVPAGSH